MFTMNWSTKGTDSILIRRLMANLSFLIRQEQYKHFIILINPSSKDSVLDVGTTPDLKLKDSNYFESMFPFKSQLSIASVEDCMGLVKKFGLKKFILIQPNAKLPFRDKQFDIVTSWATLEHVGSREKQKYFLSELSRVGKKVFVTTPDKYSIYEPHTTLFFLHWLRPKFFRKIVKLIGKAFWADEKNLNILSFQEAQKTAPENLKIKKFKLLGIFSSHLIFWD